LSWIGSSLRDLPRLRNCKRRRVSSWDKSGGNDDYLIIKSRESATIADIRGAGCITHIWVTMDCSAPYYLRKILIRMFWDDEENPSVEVPIGDFFGIGHAIRKNFVSLPLTMSPENGRGFNCFFPMPFSKRAVIEIVNESEQAMIFYYYIDYEEYTKLEENLGRFHATWNRENPCEGIPDFGMDNWEYLFGGKNLDGKGNYVILEAEGKGHYVGCNLNIHNLRLTRENWNWYGEGDDMIFIDGDNLPTINGTGTEDYFNTAFCPAQEYCAPYHGITVPGGKNWSGKISMYRFHIEDPIYFEKSIRVTIEHGHANRRSDDYSSTAYWYQTEPHKKFKPMLPVEKRLPREDPKEID